MTVYSPADHNAAVLQLVRDAWHLVGDAQTPDGVTYDGQARLIEPYAVVYPLGSATFDGSTSADDQQADAWPVTQITYTGRSREHADALRALIRGQVLGQTVTVAGRRVGPIRLDLELGVQRDDDVKPPLFYAVDRIRCYTTPS